MSKRLTRFGGPWSVAFLTPFSLPLVVSRAAAFAEKSEYLWAANEAGSGEVHIPHG